MQGYYVEGAGMAHKCCRPHDKAFNCRVHGTFNVRVPNFRILDLRPSFVISPKRYYFLVLEKDGVEYPGWAIRDMCSRQRQNTLEVLTKELLPDSLKTGRIDVRFPVKWDSETLGHWTAKQYWFQDFPFAPVHRADSQAVWKLIDRVEWSGRKVLDYGCHYGYFSFETSKRGASVVGVDSNAASLERAKTIRDHVVQQDVRFVHGRVLPNESKAYDVVLYLSVLHQVDPTYRTLEVVRERLLRLAREHAFVELIVPPTFPKNSQLTERDIDGIMGGTVLKRYKHAVRGHRKVYHLEAER